MSSRELSKARTEDWMNIKRAQYAREEAEQKAAAERPVTKQANDLIARLDRIAAKFKKMGL